MLHVIIKPLHSIDRDPPTMLHRPTTINHSNPCMVTPVVGVTTNILPGEVQRSLRKRLKCLNQTHTTQERTTSRDFLNHSPKPQSRSIPKKATIDSTSNTEALFLFKFLHTIIGHDEQTTILTHKSARGNAAEPSTIFSVLAKQNSLPSNFPPSSAVTDGNYRGSKFCPECQSRIEILIIKHRVFLLRL